MTACHEPRSDGPAGSRGPGQDGRGGDSASGDDRGAVTYATLCASCHGELGEGASAPALDAWMRSREELVRTIDMRMPLGNPERCTGECAELIADYILEHLQVAPPTCESVEPPPQALRLLTRREYRSTVRDLLHLEAMPCRADAECDLGTESCRGGTCARDACNVVTFLFDPGGRTLGSVVISGDFNGWAETPALGAWPLAYDAASRLWVSKREVPDGEHLYKLLIDGHEWRADPRNPARVPDGFGGENSRLDVRCSGAPSTPLSSVGDIAANFPVESRPAGYPFDNHAEGGLITAVHVTESMAAARVLSAAAVARLDRLLPCARGGDRRDCASQFVRDFGRRAFRRPLLPEETTKYEALVAASPTLEAGVGVALRVMLSSPNFLYRSEIGVADGDGFALTPWEVASALSYALWGTMPDEALFAAAERGDLGRPEGLEREARRLLDDPRSRETLATFALQWLGVEGLREVPKNSATYPDFTDSLRDALLEETRRFFTHVVFEGTHRFDELLTGRATFVNGELARLYGISGNFGANLAPAPLPETRSGLLTLGSVLATYALSDQSSPIKRGVFVRERLLCQKFGVPPPDAGGLPPVDPAATTRERFAMHTAKASCRSCHQYIDSVGFGFERFDGAGKYREVEVGRPIDASGNMNDVDGMGTHTDAPFDTVPELAAVLAGSRGAADCFATQYWRFVHGALETAHDRCALEDLRRKFEASGGDIRELIIDVVRSPTFVRRRSP